MIGRRFRLNVLRHLYAVIFEALDNFQPCLAFEKTENTFRHNGAFLSTGPIASSPMGFGGAPGYSEMLRKSHCVEVPTGMTERIRSHVVISPESTLAC